MNTTSTIKLLLTTFLSFSFFLINAQENNIIGSIKDVDGNPIANAQVNIIELQKETYCDSNGVFSFHDIKNGTYTINCYAEGYEYKEYQFTHDISQTTNINIVLKEYIKNELNEVVISGTMKAVSKLESPIPVEVYSSTYFKSNPTPSLFDALQNINGVRPQLNCNICNTGDIHINGLEGPYTMILIDGMPIVSGLATVYGLSGIPQ